MLLDRAVYLQRPLQTPQEPVSFRLAVTRRSSVLGPLLHLSFPDCDAP